MILFECSVTNLGGIEHKYRVREADIEPAIPGEPLQISDLLSALESIYGFSEDAPSLNETIKFSFEMVDK